MICWACGNECELTEEFRCEICGAEMTEDMIRDYQEKRVGDLKQKIDVNYSAIE